MVEDKDLNNISMIDLFRTEVEEQCKVLTECLLLLEEGQESAGCLEALMRAAHSVKGAARLVGIEPVVRVAHMMEDVFVAAQKSELNIGTDDIDTLLNGVDTIKSISRLPEKEMKDWEGMNRRKLDRLIDAVESIKPSGKGDGTAGFKADVPAKETSFRADESMLDLFRTEVEWQCKVLIESLLLLEEDQEANGRLEALMRAAHSVKGAARLVGIEPVVRVAHMMEDVFVAAMSLEVTLSKSHIDILLEAVDMIKSGSQLSMEVLEDWPFNHAEELKDILGALERIKSQKNVFLDRSGEQEVAPIGKPEDAAYEKEEKRSAGEPKKVGMADAGKQRILRVTADRWNQLMGLAAEVKVEVGWLNPYVDSLARLKLQQTELVEILDSLRESLGEHHIQEEVYKQLITAQVKAVECRRFLADKTCELDNYNRRVNNLSERLHREAIRTRMRPLSDGVHGFQRMVRDIARKLGKKVKLEINGLSTQVDRDVLERMEAPLNHILRNAIDHGVEPPEDRLKAGKPEQATIRLTAAHCNGMLSIIVEDDGMGIDLDRLREKIVEKGQVTPEMATCLSDEELLEFLFLPNFSTREEVTEISGRGVGLDVVLDTIQEMHGSIRTKTELGAGTRFHIELPITLSVVSALIVDISGEPYAFPLARINHAVKVPAGNVKLLEDHQFVTINDKHIGLVGASEVLGLGTQVIEGDELSVVIIGNHRGNYGVVVDRFVGQKDLAIQQLDSTLGKLKDISSAAILEDGSPVLMVDVDDLVPSVAAIINGDGIGKVKRTTGEGAEVVRKHILVVDDSLTVREVERNLLEAAGYETDVAVDGVDGWNAIRSFRYYDLVITDVDMPRMDGIELVRTIKGSRNYNSLPVIIVSYKERVEDRKRGLDAGADYYLTKGSFHDNTFLDAVVDLIGEAET